MSGERVYAGFGCDKEYLVCARLVWVWFGWRCLCRALSVLGGGHGVGVVWISQGSAFGASSLSECLTWVFGSGSGERSGVTFTSTHGPSCIFLCDMGL